MKTVSVGGEDFRIQEAVVVIGADGEPLAPGSLSGDASAANQAAVQANAGSNSSKATGIQGVDNGKAVLVSNATAVRTPTISTVVLGGTLAGGFKYAKFIFSSDFIGTILGAAFVGADSFFELPKLGDGETYDDIVYTRAAGTLRILSF